MARIYPVSDLRDYNKILQDCQNGQPVYLTKNGRGKYVILDMASYEQQTAQLALLTKLFEGEASVGKKQEGLSTD